MDAGNILRRHMMRVLAMLLFQQVQMQVKRDDSYSVLFSLFIYKSRFIILQELNIQRPPTPTRGRPQPDLDRNSLAYI